MLSLHPQDINNNPCYLPYRSLAAPSSYLSYPRGGAVQPPSPQEERMNMDTPVSPRTSPTTTSSSFRNDQPAPCSPYQSHNSPAAAVTISPPADYNNLDANVVAEALEVARDSPDGARDPVVSGILESALSQIWDRVMANPESYVMTTGEFAVFNFYQHRFVGNKIAISARRRFWDHSHA